MPRTCGCCGGQATEGNFGDPGTQWASDWYCSNCWKTWARQQSRPTGSAWAGSRLRPADIKPASSAPAGAEPRSLNSIDVARKLAEEKKLARQASEKAEQESLKRFWALERGELVPVVFWGICDLKYDSRLEPRERVKVTELGDGKSSRFSHHGEHIKEKFNSNFCLSADHFNCAVMIDNKKVQHDTFVECGFEHLRPSQFCYPRQYRRTLAEEIQRDLQVSTSDSVILKLVNRQRGAGVLACPVAELDATLKVLLTPPQDDALQDWLVRHRPEPEALSFSGDLLDEQQRHYWANECPIFVVERLCHSEPMQSPNGPSNGQSQSDEQFDGTMRVAFAIQRKAWGALCIHWLGGYWKLPPLPMAQDPQRLPEVHGQIVSSFNTGEKRTAPVTEEQLRDVYAAVEPALTQVFDREGFNEKTIERMYGGHPTLCAFLLARAACTKRFCDQEKSMELLKVAEEKVSEASATSKPLPISAVSSYIERARANNLVSFGTFSEGLACAEAAVNHWPTNATARYLQGVCLQERKQYASAVEHYLDACALDPDFRSPLIGLSYCWYWLGRYRDVICASDACLHRQPDSAHAHYNKAQAIYQMLCRGMWHTREQEAAELRQSGLEALMAAKREKPKEKMWLSMDDEVIKFFQLPFQEGLARPKQPENAWMQYGWRPGG